jgi:DNA gyrase subunit A
MMITKNGQIVRTAASGISVIGRNTQGVRCMNLNDDDKLVAAARVPSEEETPEEASEGAPHPHA